MSIKVLEDRQAYVEEASRLADHLLTNLKFHSLLKRLFQAALDIGELLLQQFHLEGL